MSLPGSSRGRIRGRVPAVAALIAALVVTACAPASPSPTPAAQKPATQPTAQAKATTAEPAKPTAAPAAPAASPAASPAAKTAASPAAKPTVAPAAKAEPKPATKAAFDEQAVANFYRNKTVRIIVGSSAGGGYDTYARVVGRHLGKHIPGNPNVIVENMPGAGSLVATNHVYNAADKDGTVIGHIQGGLFLQQLFGQEGIQFESTRFQFLGVPTGEIATCWAHRRTGITSVQDVIGPNAKEYIVGGNAPGSATWDIPMRLRHAIDLRVRMVDGYGGTADSRLAVDRGEIDGICGQGYSSLRSTTWEQVQSGEHVVFLRLGPPERQLEGLENVPAAITLAQTEQGRQIIRLGIDLVQQVQRPFLMAPEVPQDRVAALRAAFQATMEDPQFLRDAEQAQLELDPVFGEEVQRGVEELFQMPQELRDLLRRINNREV